MSNELGRRIKAARERKRWTQAELAARVGVTGRTIGNWERGDTVPMNRLGLLKEVLGDDIDPAVPVRVSRVHDARAEASMMAAHFADLSELDMLRLATLLRTIALEGGEGDGR